MGSNIHDFLKGLDEFVDEVDENVGKIHRAVALEGLTGVVRMTPVDSGRARGAWTVQSNTDLAAELGGIAALLDDMNDKSGSATVARGMAEIQRARPYSITAIANPVPYIETLENGHSQQAPQGMLNVTANRLRAWLQRGR